MQTRRSRKLVVIEDVNKDLSHKDNARTKDHSFVHKDKDNIAAY